jgi:hypothetical protein
LSEGKEVIEMKYVLTVCVLGMLLSCGQQQETAGVPDLTSDAKQFVDLLVKEDYAGVFSRFDNTMQNSMPESKIEEVWTSMQSQLGQYEKQVGVRQTTEQGWDCVYVTCEFEKKRIDIKIVFNKQKQVSGLWFK